MGGLELQDGREWDGDSKATVATTFPTRVTGLVNTKEGQPRAVPLADDWISPELLLALCKQ